MAWSIINRLKNGESLVNNPNLARCFDEWYFKGEMANLGEKVLAALMDENPDYGKLGSRKIPRAWRALKAWRRLAPQSRSKPESSAVVCM